MESIERDIKELISKGDFENQAYWLKTGVQPPNKKDTDKNRSIIQLMLSGIFQYKFPDYEPKFVIGWNPTEKKYSIAVVELKHSVQA